MFSEKPIADAEIMVVDDTLANLQLLVKMLQDNGYRVRAANTGELALASIEAKKPDLVLLDVMLPGLNGYEVCEQIKLNPATATIPVLFITCLEDMKEKLRGFSAGGSDYITKPFEMSEVLARVENHLRLYFAHQQLEAANIALSEEISQREHAEYDLYNEKELLRTTLLSIGDGVICTDWDGNVTLMNDMAKSLTGWMDDSACGVCFEEVFDIINETTRAKCCNPVLSVINTGQVVELANHTLLIAQDGTETPIADSAAPIIDNHGRNVGVVVVFRDMTSEYTRLKEIEYLSYHDQLTGLYNRRFFEEELTRLDTSRTLPITLIMGDINGLKLVNDAFGHAEGDALIQRIAGVISKKFRCEDIACRYGGDEFVAILPNTDSAEAETIISRVIKEVDDCTDDITSISFGYDTKTSEDQDISQILKNAEDYMYKRKISESPSFRNTTLKTILNTLYEKSTREEEHSERVSLLSYKMGQALNLSDYATNDLKMTGLLHDIGKIILDDSVLNKPGKLTDDEWIQIKSHPDVGYRIINNTSGMSSFAENVLAHHERWDGAGYPRGLSGTEIPYVSRIIAVIDAFDAMTSQRSYRDALSEDVAVAEIIRCAGTQFDPELARTFVEVVLGQKWVKQ